MKKARGLSLRYFIVFIAVLFILLLLLSLISAALASVWFYENSIQAMKSDLLTRARLMGPVLQPILDEQKYAQIEEKLYSLSSLGEVGITLISPRERVFFAGETDVLSYENLLIRQEIRDAGVRGEGASSRYDAGTGAMVVSVAIIIGETNGWLLRLSASDDFSVIASPLVRELAIAGIAALFVIGITTLWQLSQRLLAPYRHLDRITGRLATAHGIINSLPGTIVAGDAVSRYPEISGTETVLHRMSDRLAVQENNGAQRELYETSILSNMTEGVLAVDRDLRVLICNPAVLSMFKVTPRDVKGERIEQVFPGMSVVNIFEKIMEQGLPVEQTLTVLGREDLVFLVTGSRLSDSTRGEYGYLLVFRDITRIRKLENIRKEFASNVSHELKTPLTSIKGFAETLMDSRDLSGEERDKFLGIIQKQTSRVIAIVEDLLELSRIEKDAEQGTINLENTAIKPLLAEAAEVCGIVSEKKRIRLVIECPEDLKARVHSYLFEQAIVNLAENAIKYSDEGSVVTVSAGQKPGETWIAVRDHGCGIASEHFDRLFERFYRVDKARSREMGGTGLGLAIVKHIVNAHEGRITVESEVGKGSTFTIFLPEPESYPGMEA